MRYVGIKAHFEGFTNHDSLAMFSFKGAYAGISPIENGKFNFACLADRDKMKKEESPEEFIKRLRTENRAFDAFYADGRNLFVDWMSVSIPQFGIKHTPHWENTYFIGDAAGTIPPATGGGLSLAIASGILAAEYAMKNDPDGFKRRWGASYRSQIAWGKYLHQIMTHPVLSTSFVKCSKAFPFISRAAYRLTHNC